MPLIQEIVEESPPPSITHSASSTPIPPQQDAHYGSCDTSPNLLASRLCALVIPEDMNAVDYGELENLYTKTLKGVSSLLAHSGDGNSVEIEPGMGHSLMEWLALVARPPGKLFTPSEVVKGKEEEEQEKQRNEGEEVNKLEATLVLHYFHTINSIFALVKYLLHWFPPSESIPTLFATFTDPTQPWVNKETHSLALSILSNLFSSPHSSNPISLDSATEHILQSTIKPLFAPYTRATTTTRHLNSTLDRAAVPPSFSRKAPDPQLITSDVAIPWIQHRPETLTLLAFILNAHPLVNVAQLTPLLLPPLLTLIDYPPHITYTKPVAIHLLRNFARRLPSSYLLSPPHGRGLGDIIWEAVFPYLHWLPPLTPTNQSVKILKETYPTLIALAEDMYTDNPRERGRRLDLIMREGVKGTVGYCEEQAKVIGEVLYALEPTVCKKPEECVVELGLIKAMGVSSLKHLNFLIPWLCGILSNPFSALRTSILVVGAVRVLRALVIDGGLWIRIRYPDREYVGGVEQSERVWQWDIIKACVDAWIILQQELPSGTAKLQVSDVDEKTQRESDNVRKRREIYEAMDWLIGFVGILERVCVFMDPKTGMQSGGEEWDMVVAGLLEVEEEGFEKTEGNEGREKAKSMERKRQGIRMLLGLEDTESVGHGSSEHADGNNWSQRNRELHELFGR